MVIVILSVNRCRTSVKKMDHLEAQTEHNLKVGKDTVRIIINKRGFTEFDKLAYVGKIENLKKLSDSLAAEASAVKGEVANLTRMVMKYRADSVVFANTLEEYGEGRYGLAFKYAARDSGAVQNIEGISRFKINETGKVVPDYTILTKNELALKVTVGHKKVKGGYEFFATSKSPNFVLTDAESFVAVPEPKVPKKFGIGLHAGYGLALDGTGLKLAPTVSLGINYNIISF